MYLFWDYSGQSKVNTDGRIKRGGKTTNFYVHYEVDDDEVATALSLNEYGGDDEDFPVTTARAGRCACGGPLRRFLDVR